MNCTYALKNERNEFSHAEAIQRCVGFEYGHIKSKLDEKVC